MSTIKIRAKNNNGITAIKALINHPMETGLRKDNKTGKLIPAHFIQHLSCKHNDKIVLTANWGTAISKNPYLSFNLKNTNPGDSITLSWNDNMGKTDSQTVQVK